jgi:hypothetical protein
MFLTGYIFFRNVENINDKTREIKIDIFIFFFIALFGSSLICGFLVGVAKFLTGNSFFD